MTGANIQCQQSGAAEICGSVSNPSPAKSTSVIVYGRLRIGGVAQAGQAMSSTWHYKSTTPTCDSGITSAAGLAECSRMIGGATSGFTVKIDVSIGGYHVSTSFTPP